MTSLDVHHTAGAALFLTQNDTGEGEERGVCDVCVSVNLDR